MPVSRRALPLSLALLPLLAGAAMAQSRQPIVLVVPYAAGGGTDILGRAFAQPFGQALGRTVVVENRSGAAGHIGTTSVARARPDGNTLLYAVSTHIVVNPHLQPNDRIDIATALVPVLQTVSYQYVLAVDPRLGVGSVQELLALARSRPPGTLTYSSAGVGSNNHLSAVAFADAAGIAMEHISFRGSAAALLEVVAGRVAMVFSSPAPALPLVQEGSVRALAVTGNHRMGPLPETPTLREAGLPVAITGWHGVFAPAGTPAELLDAYERAAGIAAAAPEFRERLRLEGLEPPPEQARAAFAAAVQAESAYWGRRLREMNIRME